MEGEEVLEHNPAVQEVAGGGAPAVVMAMEQNVEHPPISRRRSFEDFAELDTLVADMYQNITQMAGVVENVVIGFPRPTKCSVEQAILLSSALENVQPMMEVLGQKLQQGLEIFRPPTRPTASLLQITARNMTALGDNSLAQKVLTNPEFLTTAGWGTLNTVFRIFSLQDQEIMRYLRHLQAQSPSAVPILPGHLDTGNTFLVIGDNGAYFFGEEYLARAPHPAQLQENQNDGSDGIIMASDTDDESTTD